MRFQVNGPPVHTVFSTGTQKSAWIYCSTVAIYNMLCDWLDCQDFNSKLIATFLGGDAKLKNDFCVC